MGLLATTARRCGPTGEALARCGRRLLRPGAAGWPRSWAGIVLWSVGRHDEAARVLDEGLAVARDLGNAWWIAYGLAYRSTVHASQGDLDARAG